MRGPSVLALPLAAALLVTASESRAATIQIEDVFDPPDVVFSRESGGTCIGDIGTDTVSGTDAVGCMSLVYSYALTPDTLLSASLMLYLRDDADPGSNPEAFRVTLDDLQAEYTILTSPFRFDVLANLSADGLLTVSLERGSQGFGQADFYFDRSILFGESLAGGSDTRLEATAIVPEPAPLLLLGVGGAGMLLRVRRRKPR